METKRSSTLTFKLSTGENIAVSVDRSDSVMSFARDANVRSVIGRCGGYATCGTCHMYASAENPNSIRQTPSEESDVIAGMGEELRPSSRLTCQIHVTPNSPDLEFDVPA